MALVLMGLTIISSVQSNLKYIFQNLGRSSSTGEILVITIRQNPTTKVVNYTLKQLIFFFS